MIKTLKSQILRVWHDPVWSKVIANGLLFLIGAGVYFFRDRINFLSGTTVVNNSVILIVSMVITAWGGWFLWRLVRSILRKPSLPVDVPSPFEITCVNVKRVPVFYKYGAVRRFAVPTKPTTDKDQDYALVAKFLLKARPGAVTLSMKAVVNVIDDRDENDQFINDGVWIEGETNHYVAIRPGGFAELVVAIQRNSRLYFCDREYIHDDFGAFEQMLGSHIKAKVELIGSRGNDIVVTEAFQFKIDLKPNFSFEQITE